MVGVVKLFQIFSLDRYRKHGVSSSIHEINPRLVITNYVQCYNWLKSIMLHQHCCSTLLLQNGVKMLSSPFSPLLENIFSPTVSCFPHPDCLYSNISLTGDLWVRIPPLLMFSFTSSALMASPQVCNFSLSINNH